ncbi:MAG TPA: hypothetical protein VGH13_26445 [Xanthobacteraceae bacterium]
MARTHVAIAVAGMFFAGFSGSLQAAPIAPLAGADTHPAPVTQASWQGEWHGDRHGDRHGDWHGHDRFGGFLGHRRSTGRHGGIMSRFGGMRSIMAMMGRMGGTEGGGGLSMLNAIGGMGGMQSMMSAMSGMGSGGMEQMLGAMGGGMGGGMGGSGGMQAMIGAMGGGGMTGGGGHASESARQACTPDAMRLCSDAIPDVAKVKACMQAKSSQLSEPCRAAMNGGGGTQPASASREFAASAGSRDSANFTPRQRFANGGAQSFDNFRGGREYDSFQAGQGYQSYQGYDSAGGVQAFGGRGYDNFEGGGYGGGRGDINVGQLMGMARSMGFGGRDGW